MTPQQIHNKDVGLLVRAIVKPTMDAGGQFSHVLVLLESVIVGVLLVGTKLGFGDVDQVLDTLVSSVKERVKFLRTDMKPEGTA